MPELGVELPVSVPERIQREYRLDVYAASEIVSVSNPTIALTTSTPTNKCILLTACCSEQLETFFKTSE
jgi:hypothetical protein